MASAGFCGILGTALTFWISTRTFGFGAAQVALAVLSSNLAGFVALLLTLALERRLVIRRFLMGNQLKTWGVLAALYVSGMIGLDPDLRSPATLAALFVPLVFSNGFMLPVWGLAQDRLLRWEQKHARKRPRVRENESDQDMVRIKT